MTQQGIDRDFTYLSIQDNQQPRKLPPALQPRSRTGQSPIPSQQTQPQQQIYRAVPAVYKASYRAPDDDLPPPPLPKVLGGYPDDDYLPPPPPPPLDMRASHRFIDQNDSYPPPPPLQPSLEYMPQEVNVRTTSTGHSVQTSYGAPASSYDSRADYVTATTGYDSRNVQQQPTYANQADVRATARQPVGVAPGGGTKNYVNINIPPSQSYGAPNPSAPLQYMRPGSVSPSGYRNQTRSPQLDSHHPHPPPPPPPPPPISKLPEQTSLSRSDKAGKEAEVDALTNLLMQNMESVGDPDFFGICAKCGRKVIGESSGCTAMDQVFHISCFICASCGTVLRGKSFYAMETKPFCESCYINTLEKCSVCSKPITDRLLRATGKPYHPACFTCVVCGKSLDGVPFTVDATNQIHCIEDFHKKFAPRCCICQHPIMPKPGEDETVRFVAMDRSFHVDCYRCEDCGLLLSSELEGRGCYPLDDHILCKNCNAKRIQALTTKMTTEL